MTDTAVTTNPAKFKLPQFTAPLKGGQYGVANINKGFDMVLDLGIIGKDLFVDKAIFEVMTPAFDLMGLAKSGVDLKTLSMEGVELLQESDSDDRKAFLDHVSSKLPGLGLPQVEKIAKDSMVFLLDFAVWAEGRYGELMVFIARAKALKTAIAG